MDNPDAVSVEVQEKDNICIGIEVAPEDMGKVIGKQDVLPKRFVPWLSGGHQGREKKQAWKLSKKRGQNCPLFDINYDKRFILAKGCKKRGIFHGPDNYRKSPFPSWC